jgi:hypothetical protein
MQPAAVARSEGKPMRARLDLAKPSIVEDRRINAIPDHMRHGRLDNVLHDPPFGLRFKDDARMKSVDIAAPKKIGAADDAKTLLFEGAIKEANARKETED